MAGPAGTTIGFPVSQSRQDSDDLRSDEEHESTPVASPEPPFLDVVVGEAAHDLRAPVAALVGAARLLAAGEVSPETADRLTEIIDRSEATIDSVIDDLVDRARRTSDAQPPSRRLERLRPVLERAAAVVTAARSVAVAIDGDPDLEAWVDPVALLRVVQNLVDNAARHSGCDRVGLTAERVGSDVVIEVVDDGPGLPAAALDVLSGTTRTAIGARSGLGLLTVRRLVVELGGTVLVDPDWPGTRVVVSVPQRGPLDDARGPTPAASRAATW